MIPAYNEEERLPQTLDAYIPVLRRLGLPFEIIVIADGRDRTPAIANSYHTDFVRCFEFSHKLGRGGAIFEGFKRARYPVVAYSDADGSVPPGDLEGILDLALKGAPAVIASRRLVPDIVVVPETRLRRFIGTAWHLLVRVLLGLRVKDAQCGLKVFSRDVVRQHVLPKVQVTNRTFEVGMLYHIQHAGVPIREIPVRYVHDFRTRMPVTRAIPVMFLTLVGIFVVNRLLSVSVRPPALFKDLNARFKSV